MEQSEQTVREAQKPADDWGLAGRAMERFERPFRRAVEKYDAAIEQAEREAWWVRPLDAMAVPVATLAAVIATGHGDLALNAIAVAGAVALIARRAYARRGGHPDSVHRSERDPTGVLWWLGAVGVLAGGVVLAAEASSRRLVALGVVATVLAVFAIVGEAIAAAGRSRRRAASPDPFALR
jgi:hypothetical protein